MRTSARWRPSALSLIIAALLLPSLAGAAPPSVRERAATVARALKKGAGPSARVRRLANDRPVIELNYDQAQVSRYHQALGADTVEVLFRPQASQWGHLLVRAGDRIYDYGNVRSALDADFVQHESRGGGLMYGFVLGCQPKTIAAMQRQFSQKAKDARSGKLPFDTYGIKGESCGSFVTKVLHQLAPELGVRTTSGAVQACQSLLKRNPNLAAITIYSREPGGVAGRDDFRFDKLE